MIYKNQPFLFLNNDNKECLFYCEAEKTITLHFGNDYEITPWKVALIVDGVKTDIQLPRLLSEFGDIVIECNPHIIVENESPVFYYVAGFLLNEGSPIIYYLCSLETDWEFKEFKNLKIIKNTFSGTIINNEIISTSHFGRLTVGDITYDSFENIEHIYRIIPIDQNKNYFLITASINKEDVSIVVKSDLSSYCVLKNKENKNVYKSTILNNKIVYTVKNANSGLVEDRSLVEEEFANDFELNLIPTNIKKNNPPLPVVKDLKHFAKGAVKAVKAMTLPETEESKTRLAVCHKCDKWTGTSCKVCGCFVKLKVKIPQEKCPEGKW